MTSAEPLFEVTIETDEVFATLGHNNRQPRIGKIVSAERIVETELTETLPLGTEFRESGAGKLQQRIDES